MAVAIQLTCGPEVQEAGEGLAAPGQGRLARQTKVLRAGLPEVRAMALAAVVPVRLASMVLALPLVTVAMAFLLQLRGRRSLTPVAVGAAGRPLPAFLVLVVLVVVVMVTLRAVLMGRRTRGAGAVLDRAIPVLLLAVRAGAV